MALFAYNALSTLRAARSKCPRDGQDWSRLV
jgi:hypothetical protein